jgi:hypothetical protein
MYTVMTPRAPEGWNKRQLLVEARLVERAAPAAAIEAEDVRRSAKGAEHHGDPAIFANMGVGLDPRAAEIQVGDVIALGRDIRAPLRRQGAVATKNSVCWRMKAISFSSNAS